MPRATATCQVACFKRPQTRIYFFLIIPPSCLYLVFFFGHLTPAVVALGIFGRIWGVRFIIPNEAMKPRYLCILDTLFPGIFCSSVCLEAVDGGDFFWLGLDLTVMLELVSETLAARWDAVPDFFAYFPLAQGFGPGCTLRKLELFCCRMQRGGVLGEAGASGLELEMQAGKKRLEECWLKKEYCQVLIG